MMQNGPILHSQNQLQKMFGRFARQDLIVVEDLDSLQPLTSIHSKIQVSNGLQSTSVIHGPQISRSGKGLKLPLFEDFQSVACAPIAKVFHFPISNFQIQFFSCREHFVQPLDFSIFVEASFVRLTNGPVAVSVEASLLVLRQKDPLPILEARICLILAKIFR